MERLKRLRAEKGLSQARLAARAELDPSTVNQIERGAREASPATLRKLADALEVSLYELIEGEAPKAPAPPSLEPSFNDVLQEERRTTRGAGRAGYDTGHSSHSDYLAGIEISEIKVDLGEVSSALEEAGVDEAEAARVLEVLVKGR